MLIIHNKNQYISNISASFTHKSCISKNQPNTVINGKGKIIVLFELS